ncbi:MAG: hypothetical protein ACI9J5_002275, partial [Paraglaciecola sp.]
MADLCLIEAVQQPSIIEMQNETVVHATVMSAKIAHR